MSLLNLSFAELAALFGALAGVVVALYLLDRSRRRQVVATLRFWASARNPTELKHRRRIQQPWSLVLQLASLLLLLLAIAELRFGAFDRSRRDHVLILDTSAWMGARVRQGRLIDESRRAARAWVRSLPSSDRVMVVRADALATPASGFESDRNTIYEAIRQSQPGATALNLDQAFAFARQAQKLHARRPGEIVFAGAGRIPESEAALARPAPSNLRILPVAAALENCGLRKIGLRRSLSDPDTWEIFVSAKNYGSTLRVVPLTVQFGGAPVGSKMLTLKPGGEESATFTWRTRAAGWLEARLDSRDAFPQDDRAVLELPARPVLRVLVYSGEPADFGPVLSANPEVAPVFESPARYDASARADIMVLDRFIPPAPPKVESIWIAPPAGKSPVAVKTTRRGAHLARWHGENPLGAGLRTKDVVLDNAEVFQAAPGDIPVADVDAGPVILARPGRPDQPRLVVLGFHPFRTALKYDLATPLLFANILRWMSPEIFRRWEVYAGSPGAVTVDLDENTGPGSIRVVTEKGTPLPYTVENGSLRFFAGAPGTVRVLTGDREMVYSLTLPDVAEAVWKPPANVRRGVPHGFAQAAQPAELWPWLALLGALGLLTDWLLFGRARSFRLPPGSIVRGGVGRHFRWRKAS